MNRIDTPLKTTTLTHFDGFTSLPSATIPRLVVLLLGADEEAALAGRILALAQPRGLQVLLVGIALDPNSKTELRRKLVTIAAFLRDERSATRSDSGKFAAAPTVEIQIKEGRDWLQQLSLELQSTDLLACYAEQRIGARPRPLSDVLSSRLAMPIYTFSGLDIPDAQTSLVARAASWLGSIALIGAFFMLQAQILNALDGGTQTVLLLLTVCAEVALIWILNSLLGQS